MTGYTCDVLIVGAGPAGLFLADKLSRVSKKKIILVDMGRRMEDRKCPQTIRCNCDRCDILEGIGGAGGFSDGKNTYSLGRGTQMETVFQKDHDEKYLKEIDEITLFFGSEGYETKPSPIRPEMFRETKFNFETYHLRHIGSDGIREFIINYSKSISERVIILSDFEVESFLPAPTDKMSHLLTGKHEDQPAHITCKYVVFATGLQGVPWLEYYMATLGISFRTGPAGFGIRFEAPEKQLDKLFNLFYDFKLTYHHGPFILRSFCCNRDGYVINENHRTLGIKNVNGHSYLNKGTYHSGFSNFSIIAKINSSSLDAQQIVRRLGRRINVVTGGTAYQVASDFISGRPTPIGKCVPRTNEQAIGGIDISSLLDKALADAFRSFIIDLAEVVELSLSECTIYAPEIKYYGMKFPVNFRNWRLDGLENTYVIGNATGYLDSFVSAAVTGLIAAEDIAFR